MSFNKLVLIGFLAFISCTKIGRNITVKGKVVNPVTNEPIEGVKVQLVRSTNFQIPGGYKEIKHTFSDINGVFELNATRLGDVWIQAQRGEDYYVLGWYQDGIYVSDDFRSQVQKRKTMEMDFHLVPYGEYQIIVNNINCENLNDTIIINQQNQVNSFFDSDWILSGCDGYTTTFSKVPMGNIFISWTVIRNGISESFLDTVFLNDGAQLVYELNY
jgi:hypothetical protein